MVCSNFWYRFLTTVVFPLQVALEKKNIFSRM